jgi:pimeloyl-ACP methyl ester carboxylesterase
MRPEKVHLNTDGALKVLAQRFDATVLDAELSLLGHSFGTGAALQFAARAKVLRIVLISPFNTLKQAVALQSWFLSIIMPAQIDNKKIIRELLQSDRPPKISILHGSLDTVLPVTMGRELGAIAPEQIDFYEFATDDHVSILPTRRDMIFSILNGRAD